MVVFSFPGAAFSCHRVLFSCPRGSVQGRVQVSPGCSLCFAGSRLVFLLVVFGFPMVACRCAKGAIRFLLVVCSSFPLVEFGVPSVVFRFLVVVV